MSKALDVLIVVDVQNDFCPGGALAVPRGDEVVSVTNALMQSERFDYVVATRDWHPPQHVSFATSHRGREVFDVIDVDGVEQRLWPVHCVAGSQGAEFHPQLDTSKIDAVVDKGTNVEVDSYSGFFDNRREHPTDLVRLLTEMSAQSGTELGKVRVTIVGLATDYCVAATARDARSLGFETTVVMDGCRAVNVSPSDEIDTYRDLVKSGVRLVESREILVNERAATVDTRAARVAARGV